MASQVGVSSLGDQGAVLLAAVRAAWGARAAHSAVPADTTRGRPPGSGSVAVAVGVCRGYGYIGGESRCSLGTLLAAAHAGPLGGRRA